MQEDTWIAGNIYATKLYEPYIKLFQYIKKSIKEIECINFSNFSDKEKQEYISIYTEIILNKLKEVL